MKKTPEVTSAKLQPMKQLRILQNLECSTLTMKIPLPSIFSLLQSKHTNYNKNTVTWT